MPLVKIGRQLADELRGLVDGVDLAKSGKPIGLNTSSDGRSGLAVTARGTCQRVPARSQKGLSAKGPSAQNKMPLIREPRTAEARGHRARVAAVMESVAEKYGGKHAEVFSPDFISVHKPGDRWFCTICFSPLACFADGQPIASNNGVGRDEETQRLTVHCSDKNCKRRQCKAMKSTFKDPASMSDAVLDRIIALMRATSARMEKSLGDVLISSRRKSGKGGKEGKGKCKGAFKVCKGSQRIKNSQGDKCNKVGKGIKDTAVVQRAVEIAIPSKPAAECFLAGSENKKRKGQPPVEVSHEQVGQSFKSESPALTAAEAAEMLLDISDRIPEVQQSYKRKRSRTKNWSPNGRKRKGPALDRTVQGDEINFQGPQSVNGLCPFSL